MTGARTATRAAWGELAALGVLTVLGCSLFVSAFGYGVLLEGNRVGPGFLPMVTGLLLLLLSGAQLASRLRPSRLGVASDRQPPEKATTDVLARSHGEQAVPETDVLGRTQADRVRHMRLVIAAILVTILLVPYVGFLIAFGLLVLFITTVVEGRPRLAAVAITLAAVGVVYGVFGVFLNVPLPSGLMDLVTGG